jgi:hypothetical protein
MTNTKYENAKDLMWEPGLPAMAEYQALASLADGALSEASQLPHLTDGVWDI